MPFISVFNKQLYRYLIVLFLGIFTNSYIIYSQEITQNIRLNWTISKIIIDTSGNTERYLNFPGFVLIEKYGKLPVYSNTSRLECDCSFKVVLSDTEYQAVPQTSFYSSYEITTEPDIQQQTSYIDGIAYANYTILPLRKNSFTGKIEILNSFTFKIVPITKEKNLVFKKASTSDHSVLSTGDWYKIQISETGVYKIDYSFLKNLGINPDQINPKNIKIYGNGGGMLPQPNSAPRIDDLAENAIYVSGENDEKFDKGDFILFYAKGPDDWKYNSTEKIYNHQLNSYIDSAYIFLTINNNPSKRVVVKPVPTGNVLYTTNSYDFHAYHELNLKTDISDYVKSGRDYFGEDFNFTTTRKFPFNVPDINTNYPVKLDIEVAARSGSNSSFDVTVDVNNFTMNVQRALVDDYLADYCVPEREVFSFIPKQPNLEVTLKYNKTSPNSVGWLNYIVFNSRAVLNFTGNQLLFRDTGAINNGFSEFQLSNTYSDMIVWNITDQTNVEQQTIYTSGGKNIFKTDGKKLYDFIAFRDGTGLTPTYGFKINNQDLHSITGVDMVIVTHPNFTDAANKLADYHRNSDTLNVEVVTPEQIYNEFSSGAQDITAIRDFMKMLYDKGINGIKKPKFLLLFGDASYDYKYLFKNNTNFVPTYESYSSYSPTYAYASDDYYGFLDNNEGNFDDGGFYDKADISIGRFPIQTLQEGYDMIDKILNYKEKVSFGSWRNNIMLIGDDQDGNLYFEGSEVIANYFEKNIKELNIEKVYFDAFQQISTPGGARYPDAQNTIDRNINSGCIAINYIGHGGEQYLSHEKVIDLPNIKSWSNYNGLLLFITATCEFTRFDDPERVSAGEWSWLNTKGGAVVLLSTTRVVYSSENDNLINNLFRNNLFNENNGNFNRIGDIFKLTKNRSGFSVNTRKFALIGDPALILDYPKNIVITDSINFSVVDSIPDTLKALSIVTITGEIRDHNGLKMDKFNGILYPIIYDKPSELSTLGNDPDSHPADFKMFNNTIYKGIVSVTNGRFKFSFAVPKDISYKLGYGKISYYATDFKTDANGYYDNIVIGGSVRNAPNDTTGPEVHLYMNDSNFIKGGITNENPLLYAKVRDESGINTVGNGIGHELIGILDDETPIVLNNYYTANLNSYKEGIIKYPFNNLQAGKHKLYIKVWDVMNNSAEDVTEFVVKPSQTPEIMNLYNYPNPVSESTTFSFETNLSGQAFRATLQIFTPLGKLVKTIENNINTEASRVLQIKWEVKNDQGYNLTAGLYIYRLILQDAKGNMVSKSNKLILID